MKEKKEGQKIDAIKKEKESEKDVTIAPDTTKEPKKRRRHVRGIWAVTLILFLCILLGTCVWVYVIVNNNQGTFSIINFGNRTEEAKKKAEEEQYKGLKEYTNLSALFSFWYPETWILQEQNNSLILSSDSSYPASYLAGEGPDFKDTDIYIQIHFSNEPIDISREAPGGIKPKKTTAKIGSVEVTKTTYKNDEDFAEIISNFKAGNFLFTIICDSKTKNTDKIEAYNKMLASFKFDNEVIEETKNK